jgi:hypothetical protein
MVPAGKLTNANCPTAYCRDTYCQTGRGWLDEKMID